VTEAVTLNQDYEKIENIRYRGPIIDSARNKTDLQQSRMVKAPCPDCRVQISTF